ncbi:hypothetical protein FQN60_015480, partial [Etheostoma spectabile]
MEMEKAVKTRWLPNSPGFISSRGPVGVLGPDPEVRGGHRQTVTDLKEWGTSPPRVLSVVLSVYSHGGPAALSLTSGSGWVQRQASGRAPWSLQILKWHKELVEYPVTLLPCYP